jgi:hypothetical protein
VVRSNVQAVDPDLPLYDVRTMDDRIAASFAQTRGTMLLLLATAALAAALAGVAIYGSIWYSVSQRLPEIGIRLALGATRASVFTQVLGNAVWLTADRRGDRNRRVNRGRPPDRRAAVRYGGHRSGHACDGRRRGAGARSRRERRAGAACDERRPDLGAPRRVN